MCRSQKLWNFYTINKIKDKSRPVSNFNFCYRWKILSLNLSNSLFEKVAIHFRKIFPIKKILSFACLVAININ